MDSSLHSRPHPKSERRLGFIAGIWRLENGNLLLTNWGGHGGSSGGAVLEVTRDKTLVFSTGDAVKNRASSLFVEEPGAGDR